MPAQLASPGGLAGVEGRCGGWDADAAMDEDTWSSFGESESCGSASSCGSCSSSTCGDTDSEAMDCDDVAKGGGTGAEACAGGVGAETLILVDWDDTVLPSTWLLEQGLKIDGPPASQEQSHALRDLARDAARTLRAAKRLGTVVVLTNGQLGWVELSCTRFMPSLMPLLEGVKIRSARSAYEPLGVVSPLQWKCLAFSDELRALFQEASMGEQQVINILSIGDSSHEREALLRSTKGISGCWSKSVKLLTRPQLATLSKQHRFLSTCLAPIVRHGGGLDLRVQVD